MGNQRNLRKTLLTSDDLNDRIETGEAVGGKEWLAAVRELAATNVVQKSPGHQL
jgi:hypothetical protein